LLSSQLIEIDKLTIKRTALHIACSTNKKNFVTLLLAKQANTMIKDFEENTPADVTTSKEIQEIIQNNRRKRTDIFIPVDFFLKEQKNILNLRNHLKNLISYPLILL